jgi:hypothetical protein
MPRLLRYDPDNDFYKVLGVAPTATLDEIHRTYRQRAKLVHPDLNRDRREWAHDQFQRLNEAHDIIGDPERRVEYDHKRRLYQDLHRPGVRSAALAEASRAAWARRNHRRSPALYYVSVGILTIGALPLLLSIVTTLISEVNRHYSEVIEVPTPTPFMIVVPPRAPARFRPSSAYLPVASYSPEPCTDTHMMITEPYDGQEVHVPFVIRGSASGDDFSAYYVTYGPAAQYPSETFQTPSISRVERGILVPEGFTAKLANVSGDFTIQLNVLTNNGTSPLPCGISFHLNVQPGATEVTTSGNS